jgi:hypothetical protein
MVVQPFGRAGATCMARMLASAGKGGALVPSSSSYNANLRTMFALWQKAVGFEPIAAADSEAEGEGKGENAATPATPASPGAEPSGALSTLTPSVTALRLFDAFLKSTTRPCDCYCPDCSGCHSCACIRIRGAVILCRRNKRDDWPRFHQ